MTCKGQPGAAASTRCSSWRMSCRPPPTSSAAAELLTQQMGRCAQHFEMLPILKDTPEGEAIGQHDLFRRMEQVRAGTQAQGGTTP